MDVFEAYGTILLLPLFFVFLHFNGQATPYAIDQPRTTELSQKPANTFRAGDLIINEIHYAPSASSLEFVELLNRSDQGINLCSAAFSDSRDAFVEICQGVHELLPDSLVIIARDSIALNEAFPSMQVPTFYLSNWPALNNGGDVARIAIDGIVIDEVAYDPSWGGQGVSLEKIDPAGPAASTNWGSSQDALGATPGLQNSIYAPDLLPPALLLAEVSQPDKLTLFWDEPIDVAKLDLSYFNIIGTSPLAFSFINESHIELTFGFSIDEEVLAYRSVSDLTGNQAIETRQPLAYLPEPNNLLINEIMYAPLADAFDRSADQPEYIELYNIAGKPLSLRSLSLAGRPDELNVADTLKSDARYPVASAGAFVLLYAETGASDAANLRASFPALNNVSDNITFLPIKSSSLSLLNSGDRVAIVSKGNQVIDEITYSPDWHHPVLAETRGISLERRSFKAPTYLPSNWSSSVDNSGGTPGMANSIKTNVTETSYSDGLNVRPEVFSPDGDGVDDVLQIELVSENASDVTGIKVFDMNGRLVRTLVRSTITRQQEILFWDGLDDDGHLLPVGIYIIVAEVIDLFEGAVRTFKKPAVLAQQLN
ncbi:MAG: gliding motility-associated C-terminal domain-containing protein [Rhodothermales bacterium]